MIQYVKKLWGFERWLVNNNKYCAKHLHLRQRFECSTHYHILKDETFYIAAGVVDLFVYDLKKDFVLPYNPLNSTLLHPKCKHFHKGLLELKSEIIPKLKVITLKQGEQFRLKPFMLHKFRAKTSGAVILEVSTTHYETDSYRLTNSRALEVGEYDGGYC